MTHLNCDLFLVDRRVLLLLLLFTVAVDPHLLQLHFVLEAGGERGDGLRLRHAANGGRLLADAQLEALRAGICLGTGKYRTSLRTPFSRAGCRYKF